MHLPEVEGGRSGEQTCNTAVSAAIGYPCPVGNCPNSRCENITVTCNDNAANSGDYCVTVLVGCGQTAAAITAAEDHWYSIENQLSLRRADQSYVP